MQKLSSSKGSKADSLPSDRKRKLSSQPPPTQCSAANNVAAADGKQQTISDLFSNSQQKPISRDGNGLSLSPNSKRARLGRVESLSQPIELPSPPPQPSHEALSPKKMYSFGSNKGAKGQVVDLTSSPASSPPRKNGFGRNGVRTTFNPHAGAKRIVVKNFKTQTKTDPRQYFDQVWVKLDLALEQIFKNEKIAFSLEELYRSVENVCRQGHAQELSDKLVERCKVYMKGTVHANLVAKAKESNVKVLEAVLGAWKTWRAQMVCNHTHIILRIGADMLYRNKSTGSGAIWTDLFSCQKASLCKTPVMTSFDLLYIVVHNCSQA